MPEDLALILNDSSLFSNSADITTKEILKRYGDRAKAPVVSSGHAFNSSKPDSYGDASSPVPPVAHRVDTDHNMQTAWQNESSVRHVGSDANIGQSATPPTLPYAQGRHSQDSGSASSPGRGMKWDKQRAVGMA